MAEFNRGGPRRDFGGGSGNGGGGFQRDFGAPQEKHKATCSECNKECEVPFKPTAGKPVFCRDCYRKRKGF